MNINRKSEQLGLLIYNRKIYIIEKITQNYFNEKMRYDLKY